MSRICIVTGRRPVSGNHVSHAKNRVKRVFSPNLHTKRYWVESLKRYVKLKVSSRGMRTIDKRGIETVLKDIKG